MTGSGYRKRDKSGAIDWTSYYLDLFKPSHIFGPIFVETLHFQSKEAAMDHCRAHAIKFHA